MEDTKEQFVAAFEKYSDELFRHALMRLSDRETALEVTQETYLRAWKYVAEGNEVRQYRAFLYKILNNLVVDEYRKHKTQSLDALLENEETSLSFEGELLRDEVDVLEEAMIRFDSDRAVAALTELPETHRTVLVLRYIDGLSLTEIAQTLEDNENAVSVRIHRALHKLRNILSPKQTNHE